VEYLNYDCLDRLSAEEFQKRQPYPWVSIQGTLTQEGFERLHATLPDVSGFRLSTGYKRAHGQAYHDRYLLHYHPSLEVAEPWRQFIAEIHGSRYESFLRRMLALGPARKIFITLDWYYAWRGCSVSPHCDARRKWGTHIFYFDTDADWDPSWGGHVLIMDDGGRFHRHSAPNFDDLKAVATIDPRGNGSLLFHSTPHSWHGVRPLECPPDTLRKLFLVTVSIPTMQVWWRRVRGKDADGFPLKPQAKA
jgi:hypothetical protein